VAVAVAVAAVVSEAAGWAVAQVGAWAVVVPALAPDSGRVLQKGSRRRRSPQGQSCQLPIMLRVALT
jgi:hypothetical protein